MSLIDINISEIVQETHHVTDAFERTPEPAGVVSCLHCGQTATWERKDYKWRARCVSCEWRDAGVTVPQ